LTEKMTRKLAVCGAAAILGTIETGISLRRRPDDTGAFYLDRFSKPSIGHPAA
jgi:hypothetical protein